MSSPAHSKTKGRQGENEVVAYLQANGFPLAERRRLTGASDRGDIAGIEHVVIEVKTCATPDVAAWLRETETERRNANATIGAVWWRTPRRPDPQRQLVIVNVVTLAMLFGDSWPWMITFPGAIAARNLATIGDAGDLCAWWPIGSRRSLDHAAVCMPAWRFVAALRDWTKR